MMEEGGSEGGSDIDSEGEAKCWALNKRQREGERVTQLRDGSLCNVIFAPFIL